MTTSRRDEHATHRKALAFALAIGWVVIVASALLIVKTPSNTKQTSDENLTFIVFPDSNLPAVTAKLYTIYHYTGSISADNPMNVTVVLQNVTLSTTETLNGTIVPTGLTSVSDTDLLKYFPNAGFETSNGAEAEGPVPLHLTKGNTNTYAGSALITFQGEGNVYVWLNPSSGASVPGPEAYESPLVTVGPAGDTYAWQYGQETAQLTWIVIAFSLVLVQPLLETLLGWEAKK